MSRCRFLPAPPVHRRAWRPRLPAVGPRWLRLAPTVLALLAGWVASTACVPTTVVRTDLAERRWFEVRSPHVTLFTDLDADDADSLARAIEVRRRALDDLYRGMLAPGKPPASGQLAVVYLADCDDLTPIFGNRWAGLASRTRDFTRRRITLTCDDRKQFPLQTVTHELAHLMSFHFFRSLPTWLEEGLATYFQTLVFDGDELILGEYPERNHRPRLYLPPVRELRALEGEPFYELDDGYLAAWRLVHLLATGTDSDNARLRHLLRALGDGVPVADAWDDALGDRSDDQLDREYRSYLVDGELDTWVMPYHPPAPPALERRALDRGEIHDVWLQSIATFTEPPHRARHIAAQIDLAVKHAPAWAGADYWRAVLAMHERRPLPELEASLRRYVRRAPDDVRGVTALLAVALGAIDDDGLGPTPPPGLDALRDEMAALQRHSRSAVALDAMAWYFALARKPGPGEGLARRALALEPGCAECEDTLAVLLSQRGAHAEAVLHQERAVRLLGEAPVPPPWLRRLAVYRDRLRTATP
jgi:hypothetical protein